MTPLYTVRPRTQRTQREAAPRRDHEPRLAGSVTVDGRDRACLSIYDRDVCISRVRKKKLLFCFSVCGNCSTPPHTPPVLHMYDALGVV